MMKKPVSIAVFASGSGTNFQAIQNTIERGELNAKIELLITDKPGAYVVKRAEDKGIPVLALRPKEFESKEAFERQVLKSLQDSHVEWLILAGYMRLIGHTLLQAYSSKIVNIHPSLLPSFPGKDAIGQAMDHGVKVTGVTVHFVDEGMDTGKIIMQRAVSVIDGNRELTEQAIHDVEHELYPTALKSLFV